MASANTYATQPNTVRPPATRVYVKRFWADRWTAIPWLQPIDARTSLSGTDDQATFEWRFGNVTQPGMVSQSFRNFIDIAGYYIAIDAYDTYGVCTLWIGVVDQEQMSPFGTLRPAGVQRFTASGLKSLLYRRFTPGAFALCGSPTGAYVDKVDHAIPFNEDGRPNASYAPTTFGPYCFYRAAAGGDPALYWLDYDVLQYYIQWYANGLFDSGYTPQFELTGRIDLLNTVAASYSPFSSVGEALDSIITQKRGLGYRILTDFTTVYIDIFSYFADENSNTYSVDLRTKDIRAEVSIDQTRGYDAVYVEGGPVTVCSTFAVNDPSYPALVPMWSAEAEAAYAAVSLDSDDLSDAARQSSAYDSVYQRFGVTGWNWYAGAFNCAPVPLDDATLDFTRQAGNYDGRRRFLRTIPVEETTVDGVVTGWRSPFVLAVVENADGALVYANVDKLSSMDLNSASVSPEDDSMGIRVASTINHVAALGTFVAINTETEPQYDYRTYLLTAAYQTDARLRAVVWVQNARTGDVPRVKYITDRDAGVTLIAPGTALDVDPADPTGLLYSSELTVVDDLSDRIWERAVLTAKWFGQQQSTVGLTVQGISIGFQVGGVIIGVLDATGYTQVGTVVRSRAWDFLRNVTTVQTGFDDFDGGIVVTRGGRFAA